MSCRSLGLINVGNPGLHCLVGTLFLFSGCSDAPNSSGTPPVKTATPSVTTSVTAGDPGAADAAAKAPGTDAAQSPNSSGTVGLQSFDGMKFEVPAGWVRQPLSQMQMGIVAAKFGMPAISDDLLLTLSTSGGSLEDNIGRWEGQFSGGEPPRRETLSMNGQDATVVRLSGRFTPGFGRAPENGWSMTGVIIPMTGQNYFLKLTGPQAAVAAAEESFLTFCRSARPD